MSGPATNAMPNTAPNRPWYLPRSCGVNRSPMTASATGNSDPAPMPWMPRKRMSIAHVLAEAGQRRADQEDHDADHEDRLPNNTQLNQVPGKDYANLRDKLTFTATADVDYFIRVAREVPPPGDYAIVLKVSLGSPDTMVQASGFMTNYGTIYPVVDGYRDSIDIRATRGETASASIAIYNPAGTKIRTLTVPSGTGQYSVAWNGKNTAGTIQPAGKYKIISTVTDTSGNKLSDTRYVTVSSKKLVTKTFTQTLDARQVHDSSSRRGTGRRVEDLARRIPAV